jgi:Ribbon-Helix-Helix transcriptional regulator family
MAFGWLEDGDGMAAGDSEKTEKITINLGLVDLGQIDLLVQEGFYAGPAPAADRLPW